MFNQAARPAPATKLFPRPRRCRLAAALTSLSCLALVAGCGGGEDGGSGIEDIMTISPMPGTTGGLFGRFYMPQITDEWRAAAAAIRDTATRYRRQSGDVSNFSPSPVFSNPLFSSRVDYAHAVGLTGAGRVIAIVDDGFRRTHEAFAGKTNSQTGDPIVEDHGTMVASIAAGNSATMVGVAPGANLLFSSWDENDLIAAANAARTRGAVAQNNSWGFLYASGPNVETSVLADAQGYDYIFGNASGLDWLAALQAYVSNGVVIFALSNNASATRSDLMAALPTFVSSLEDGWLAVGNALPLFDDQGVYGVGARVSSACLDAARWCLMADGFWFAASGASNSSYSSAYGSSFAAPQVAGALALLSEAFPDLTPNQLRARLLATADNTFAGFQSAGSVDLLEGDDEFWHDYSLEFGHGFLDIRAALLPIGPITVARADGSRIAPKELSFQTGGAMGDAVSSALEGVEVAAKDSFGGGFDIAAKNFANSAEPAPLVDTLSARAMSKDFTATRTAPRNPLARSFDSFTGQTVDLETPDGSASASVLLGGDDSYGVALSRRVAEGVLNLDLGLKLARDDGSLMGFSDATGGGATMAALTVSLSHDLGNGGFFALSGEMGMADLATPTAMSRVSTARFDSVSLDLGGRNVFARDDRLSVGVSMPIAVSSGEAVMEVPVSLGRGRSEVRSLALDLAPTERQVDLSISYQMPMGDASEFLLELVHAENYGNRAGVTDQAAVIGMKWKF